MTCIETMCGPTGIAPLCALDVVEMLLVSRASSDHVAVAECHTKHEINELNEAS